RRLLGVVPRQVLLGLGAHGVPPQPTTRTKTRSSSSLSPESLVSPSPPSNWPISVGTSSGHQSTSLTLVEMARHAGSESSVSCFICFGNDSLRRSLRWFPLGAPR